MQFVKYSVLILLCLLFAGMVYAVLGIPHQFYGTVTVNGAPANGANIVAKINGEEFGSATSVNGTYGYEPGIFYVEDPNNNNDDKTIEFFLNANKVAEYIFNNGDSTELNLSIGTPPVCGDGTCNGNETCSSCPEDCGVCDTGGSGSGGSGGSGTASLIMNITGNCAGEDIEVEVLRFGRLKMVGAKVILRIKTGNLLTELTNAEGIAILTVNTPGTYDIWATHTGTSSLIESIEIIDCEEDTEPVTVTTTGTTEPPEDLCENVDCDDQNPCTEDTCDLGYCSYVQLSEIPCGTDSVCQEGVCVSEVEETEGTITGVTGLFGLTQFQEYGLIIFLILAVVAISYMIYKKRKNQNN